MCGIHGIINSKLSYSKPACDFIRQSFVAGSLRGMDSSGLFQIGATQKSVFLHKDAVHGSDFIQQAKAEAIIRDADTSLFTVCHVRAKTQGAVNADNAHPFVGWTEKNERVIGVHNGSLNNWKTQPGGKDYEVDSAWAIQQIAEHGHAAFPKLQGAFSIVYWDEESPRKINFVRNSQRPMHFLFSKDGTSMVFASEPGMLFWIASRAGFQHDGKVRELPVDTVVTFDTSGAKLTWETTKVKAAPVSTYGGSHYSGNRSYYGDSDWGDYRNDYGRGGDYVRSEKGSDYRPPEMVIALGRWQAVLAGAAIPEGNSTRVTNVRPLVNTRPSCEVGAACDAPFLTDSLDDEEALGNDTFPFTSDFKFPTNLIPPRKFLKATDGEITRAQNSKIYASLAMVEWETYGAKNKILYGTATDSDTDLPYDVIMVDVDKNAADRVLDTVQPTIIIGQDTDGTLVVHRLTKKMREFMTT